MELPFTIALYRSSKKKKEEINWITTDKFYLIVQSPKTLPILKAVLYDKYKVVAKNHMLLVTLFMLGSRIFFFLKSFSILRMFSQPTSMLLILCKLLLLVFGVRQKAIWPKYLSIKLIVYNITNFIPHHFTLELH